MSDQIKAVVTYKSGREEIIFGKVNKDGSASKPFAKRLADYKNFPTVVSVEIEERKSS